MHRHPKNESLFRYELKTSYSDFSFSATLSSVMSWIVSSCCCNSNGVTDGEVVEDDVVDRYESFNVFTYGENDAGGFSQRRYLPLFLLFLTLMLDSVGDVGVCWGDNTFMGDKEDDKEDVADDDIDDNDDGGGDGVNML